MVVLDETANEILHKSGWQAEVTVYATEPEAVCQKIFGKKTNITGDFSVYELIRFQRSFQAKAKKIGIPIVPSKRFVKLQTGASHDSYINSAVYSTDFSRSHSWIEKADRHPRVLSSILPCIKSMGEWVSHLA